MGFGPLIRLALVGCGDELGSCSPSCTEPAPGTWPASSPSASGSSSDFGVSDPEIERVRREVLVVANDLKPKSLLLINEFTSTLKKKLPSRREETETAEQRLTTLMEQTSATLIKEVQEYKSTSGHDMLRLGKAAVERAIEAFDAELTAVQNDLLK